MDGNVGDWMIDAACRQLLDHFRINYRELDCDTVSNHKAIPGIGHIAISGGGNLGRYYHKNFALRQAALEYGLPVTIFPQTFTDFNESIQPYHKVHVRDIVSQRLHPSTILGPDLALGYRPQIDRIKPVHGKGVFLREDQEALFAGQADSNGDPVLMCETVNEYLELAGRYNEIVTDRLHFAIAGLLMNRTVILLPNTYYKNKSMFTTWLQFLGCRWQQTI